jgi:hypothetical protein
VRPERFLVPLAAIAIAVYATSRLMVAIDPGEAHPTGLSDETATGLKGEVRRALGGGGKDGGGERRSGRKNHSFFSAAGMRELKGLIGKEAGRGGTIGLFRLQADEAQVFTRTGHGGRMLVVERGPRVRFRATTPIATPGGFALGALDPDAPRRIVAAIVRRTHGTERDIDYMVFSTSPIDRRGRWDAFLTGGATHFAADAHGRHVTQP